MQPKPPENAPWMFCEVLGTNISPEEETEIFNQLMDMKDKFLNPRDFTNNVLNMIKETQDKEKKLLLMATTGKIVGYFSR